MKVNGQSVADFNDLQTAHARWASLTAGQRLELTWNVNGTSITKALEKSSN